MRSRITERIERETGLAGLFDALAGRLSASDLQSLLIEAFSERTRGLDAADIMARADVPLAATSNVDARLLNEFDRAAFRAAEGFECVELAPVCPLGSASVLGSIDQNNLLTTIRNAELPGDPTTGLALECARRRRDPAVRRSGVVVRLCASQRVVRLQPFKFPGFTPHFRLFGLASAGRETGSREFEATHAGEHIRFYLRLCEDLGLEDPLVEISDMALTEECLRSAGVDPGEVRRRVRAHLPGSGEEFLREFRIGLPEPAEDPAREWRGLQSIELLSRIRSSVVPRLAEEFARAAFRFTIGRLEGLGYYRGTAIRISPRAPDGERYAVIDGGATDWTARLLGDRKERLMTSGIGSEFVCRKYAVSWPDSRRSPLPL